MNNCTCRIEFHTLIVFCRKHAAVDDLIAALAASDVDPDVTAVEWISAVVTDVREALSNGDWEHDDPESLAEACRNIETFVRRARAALARATGKAVT